MENADDDEQWQKDVEVEPQPCEECVCARSVPYSCDISHV